MLIARIVRTFFVAAFVFSLATVLLPTPEPNMRPPSHWVPTVIDPWHVM